MAMTTIQGGRRHRVSSTDPAAAPWIIGTVGIILAVATVAGGVQ